MTCGLTGSGVGDHLDGHQALRAELTRLVDDAHAAAAGLAQDLVAGEIREDDGRKREGRRRDWRPSVSPTSVRCPPASAATAAAARSAIRRSHIKTSPTSGVRKKTARTPTTWPPSISGWPPKPRMPSRRSPLGRGQPRRVRLKVGDLDRLSACGDEADLAHARGGRAGCARQAATSRPPRGAAGRRWRQGASRSSGPGTPGARDRWHTGRPAGPARSVPGRRGGAQPGAARSAGEVWPPTAPGPFRAAGV